MVICNREAHDEHFSALCLFISLLGGFEISSRYSKVKGI